MAVWFSDDYTNNGSDENLDDHTPSTSGDGYVKHQSGTATLVCDESADEVSPSANENNTELSYYITPRAKDGGADQDITINITNADTSGDEPIWFAWRAVGSSNLADDSWLLILGPAPLSLRIYSVVSGETTNRDNDARELAVGGALVEIETVGNDHDVYFTGSGFTGRELVLEVGPVAVNTAAGDILIGIGSNPDTTTKDIGIFWDFNSFIVDGDAPAAGGGRIMSSLVNAGGLAGVGGIAGQGGGLAN